VLPGHDCSTLKAKAENTISSLNYLSALIEECFAALKEPQFFFAEFGRRCYRYITSIWTGGFMNHQLRQIPLTGSSFNRVGPSEGLTSASVAAWRQQKWQQELEKEWEGRLGVLQQCIGELFVKINSFEAVQPRTGSSVNRT
jgi:hypothetical protein